MSQEISFDEFKKMILERVDQSSKELYESIDSMFEGFQRYRELGQKSHEPKKITSELPKESKDNEKLFNWLKGKLTELRQQGVVSDWNIKPTAQGTEVYILLDDKATKKDEVEVKNMITWVQKKAEAKSNDQKSK